MINLNHVTKSFGSLKAVDDLSLVVKRGELFSFLGPNGAGKTTTIKMLVGLMVPDEGEIEINGFNTRSQPLAAKRMIGYVPDAPFLYDKLTGREFLEVVGNLYNLDSVLVTQKIRQYRERLNIGSWLDEATESYSQGMKQRLVFTAALFHEPEILIIDEPMVGLDPQTARTIKDLLKELAAGGVTVFLSTHNLNVAEELSTRIGIIHQGSLMEVGTVESFRSSLHRQGNLEDLFLHLTGDRESSGLNAPGNDNLRSPGK